MHPDVSPPAGDHHEPVRLALVHGTSISQPPAPPSPSSQVITLEKALALYTSTHLSTLKDPGPTMSRLAHLSVFNDRPLEALTVVELQQFFNQLAVSAGPSAAYNTVKMLRHVYRKMVELQVYQGFNPATFARVKRPMARSVFLNAREVSSLWRVLADQSVGDRLFFTMLLVLFCRFGELKAARVDAFSFWLDRDTQERRCLWRKGQTKNGKTHEVPLPPQLTEELWTYLQTRTRKESPWVWPGRKGMHRTANAWWNRWSEIRSEADLDHVHIHDLRRSGSTWAVDTTGDLNTVSRDGLQHSDLKMTSIYVQSTGKKALQMYTAHEEALRAQETKSQSIPTPVPRPFSPPGVNRMTEAPPMPSRRQPVSEVTPTMPTTNGHVEDDVVEWPG